MPSIFVGWEHTGQVARYGQRHCTLHRMKGKDFEAHRHPDRANIAAILLGFGHLPFESIARNIHGGAAKIETAADSTPTRSLRTIFSDE